MWVSAVSRPPEVPRLFLPAVLVGAAVLRTLWWIWYADVLENDGVEFVRLATNWFHGHGYVSTLGGAHTMYPPFYPLLIGLLAPVAGSEEAAGRLVPLLAGVALVGVIYSIALRVFGPRVAMFAGVLAAAHPLLIALSVTTSAEGLYITMAAAASLLLVECMDRPSWARAVLAGLCVAAAYLTRPEALVLVPLLAAVLVAVYWHRGRLGRGFGLAAVLGVTTFLLATPYVIHLTRLAGSFRWEGKSSFNNLITERTRLQRMMVGEASRGVDSEGRAVGPYLFRDQTVVLRQPGAAVGSTVQGLFRDSHHQLARVIRQVLRAEAMGGIPILLLALAGFCFGGWWRGHKSEVAVILTIPLLTLLALLTLDWIWARYLLPLLPALVLFAAAGLAWIDRRSRALAVAAGVLVVAVSARGTARLFEIGQARDIDVRVAGEWIRNDYPEAVPSLTRPRIMGIRLAPVHYAQGELLYLPWGDESAALRYIHEVAPDYVMLRETERGAAPFAEKWLTLGVSDPCAERVSLPAAAAPYHVWRWTCTR